jgi:hypothetical protein
MRVKLKGLNQKKVTLANGRSVTYYYAWKGGPRIREEFGTAEFVAAYVKANEKQRRPQQDDLRSLSITVAF